MMTKLDGPKAVKTCLNSSRVSALHTGAPNLHIHLHPDLPSAKNHKPFDLRCDDLLESCLGRLLESEGGGRHGSIFDPLGIAVQLA